MQRGNSFISADNGLGPFSCVQVNCLHKSGRLGWRLASCAVRPDHAGFSPAALGYLRASVGQTAQRSQGLAWSLGLGHGDWEQGEGNTALSSPQTEGFFCSSVGKQLSLKLAVSHTSPKSGCFQRKKLNQRLSEWLMWNYLPAWRTLPWAHCLTPQTNQCHCHISEEWISAAPWVFLFWQSMNTLCNTIDFSSVCLAGISLVSNSNLLFKILLAVKKWEQLCLSLFSQSDNLLERKSPTRYYGWELFLHPFLLWIRY